MTVKKTDIVNYRKFRLNKLNTPEFEHLKYLVFWPMYGLMFMTVERLWIRDSYTPIHCALDDAIPFCELFLIPYLFWFVFMAGAIAYTLFFDPAAFKRMMKFIIVSYSVTILIYILFPNCQELRPAEFKRDNVLTRFISGFYQFDTNTNVCPSIHVIGALAVMFTGLHCRRLSRGTKAALSVLCVLMCLSTVFLKQHSLIDVAAALPVCLLAYVLCFRTPERHAKLRTARGVQRI